MVYPLQKILDLRLMRENKASSELAKCRQEIEPAKQKIEQARQELANYIQWRKAEVRNFYASIQGRGHQASFLQASVDYLSRLKERDAEFQEKINSAEEDLHKKEKKLDKAQKVYKQAVQDRRKIDIHKEKWQEEQKKATARAEELEMEDFRSPKNLF